MDRERVIGFLGSDWEKTIECISDTLKSDIDLLNVTNSFILEHSGKFVRPMMALLVARALGAVRNDTIKLAAASEMMHNATLLHDDVVDNGLTRRGVPTVLSMLGGSPSVLIGDYWLVRAISIILDTEHHDEAIAMFSKTLSDLAEGEMLQLQKAGEADTDEDDYMRIIYSKTASLFEVACMSAAMSLNVPDVVKETIKSYAVNVGLAFQVKDDIMDFAGEDIGKPVGVDVKEHKITLPLLGAFKHAGKEEEKRVRNMVRNIDGHPEYAMEIIEFVKKHNGIQYAQKVLHDLISKAIDVLKELPDTQARAYLMETASFVAERAY